MSIPRETLDCRTNLRSSISGTYDEIEWSVVRLAKLATRFAHSILESPIWRSNSAMYTKVLYLEEQTM